MQWSEVPGSGAAATGWNGRAWELADPALSKPGGMGQVMHAWGMVMVVGRAGSVSAVGLPFAWEGRHTPLGRAGAGG